MIEGLIGSPEGLLIGIVTLLLGYLIKYQEWTFLIAGYDDSSRVPKHVAADIVENFAIRVGIAVASFGAIVAVASVPEAIILACVAIIVLGTPRVIYRLHTLSPSAS